MCRRSCFTRMRHLRAELKTKSEMLNKLWSNILWGQRSNFVGLPTDCPQRDERLGWSADAQVFWRAAAYNMDLAAFSRKFSGDLRGTQVGTAMYGIFAPGTNHESPGYGTGWSDAGVMIPWTSWIQTGDRTVVDQNWDAMKKYLAAIHEANPDYLWKKNYGIPFADWLSPEGVTPVDLIATAYWAYDVTLMKQMAAATGRTAEAAEYGEMFEKIKDAFVKAYTRPDGFVGGVPPPPVFASATATRVERQPVETQTGYVLAINMNLLPESLAKSCGAAAGGSDCGESWAVGDGIFGDAVFAGGADGYGASGRCVSLAAGYELSVVGIFGGAWRDDDVGTVEWRSDARRSEHEFVQSLRVWSGGGLDLSVCGGDRYRGFGCGISYDLFASEFCGGVGGAEFFV